MALAAGPRAAEQGAQKQSALRAALGASRGAFVATGVFSFFINLLMLTSPLFMLQVYDRVLPSGSGPTLVALIGIAAIMFLVMGMLELVRSRVLVRISSGLDARLNEQVFSSAFLKSLRGPGGQRNQPLQDMNVMRQFLTGQGPFALFDAPWVPGYLAVVFLFHPILGFIALAGAVALFTIALLSEILTRKPLQRAGGAARAAEGFAETSLRNAEVLEAMGMLSGAHGRWLDRHKVAMAWQSLASDRSGALTATSKTIRIALQVAILGAGAALAIDQIITPGTMIAASIIMGRALAPVEQSIATWRGFVGARGAYARLDALMAAHTDRRAGMSLPRPVGALAVEQVTAVPPGTRTAVVKGLSFALEPGEALGVIGHSGAGKSSLARLLVGVWQPAAGHVRLDGADIHAWHRDELGPHIGYLPQDVELFDASIAENIARLAAEPDSTAVIEAATRAGVHDMILRLPEGYDTMIGEQGHVLSAGQRQRLGLARALYGNPALVVLDEPNSNLDSAGDLALTAVITDLKQSGTTTIVIAHRPSAIAAVDTLLVMADGGVQAFGPKNEVLARAVEDAGANVTRAGPVTSLETGSA